LLLIASCGATAKPPATCSQREASEFDVRRQLDDPDKGEIDGQVMDTSTCTPLAGVTVVVTSLSNPALVALTDDSGRYLTADLPSGKYTVSLEFCDVSIQREVELVGGYATQVDFTMHQQPHCRGAS
jgi:hypothetical protein